MPMPLPGRRTTLTALLGALLCGAVALGISGARSSAPQPATVALINLDTLLAGLDEVRNMERGASERFAPQREQVQALETRFNQLKSDVDTLNLPQAEIEMKRAEMVIIDAQYKAMQNTFGQLLDLEKGRMYRNIYLKALGSIAHVASQEGYDLVLLDDRKIPIPEDRPTREVMGAIISRQVLFAAERIDITRLVVDEMNNNYATGN